MEYRKLSELHKLENNPRIIKEDDLARLIQSIRDNPEYFEARPLILSDRTGELVILGGNQRYEASKFLKLDKVPTHLIKGLTEEKEREIIIRDNVSNGQWDYDLLANEWDVLDLDSWGVNIPNFDIETEPEANKDDFETIPPEEPKTKLGDLYEIGEHRLLCGDSTDIKKVELLMNGQKCNLLTDPPYGIKANNQTLGTGKKQFYRGDDWDNEVPDFFYVLALVDKAIIWGGNYFANRLDLTNDWLCWHKKNDGLSFSEFELAWSNVGKNCRLLSHHWGGEEKMHPTMKPIKVMQWCIEYLDEKPILDIFSGSGSTMVASHQLKRKCYGMELDPRYCDVIVKRMGVLDPKLTIKLNGLDVTNDWINQ